MAELTPKAARLRDRHLRRIARQLARTGHGAEEVEAVTTGLREQVDDILAGEAGPVGPERLRETLTRLEAPEAWGADRPAPPRIGRVALGLALVTVLGAVTVPAFVAEGDPGALLLTLGIAGFLGAAVLGWIDRRSGEGRAALILSAVFLVLIGAVLTVALAVPG